MASSIRITRTGPTFSAIQFSTTALMREIGEGVRSRIIQRTRAGVDSEGRAFALLSPGYAKQKQQALGHARADLTVSGRMLNDLMVFPAPKQVTLTFASAGSGPAVGRTLIQRSRSIGAADKAFWHTISGAGRARTRRPFFEMNDEDEAFAVNRLDAFLVQQVR